MTDETPSKKPCIIGALCDDLKPKKPVQMGWFVASAVGTLLLIDVISLWLIGMRSDMGTVMSVVKPGLFFIFGTMCLLLVFRLSHPGRGMTLLSTLLLICVPVMLVGAVVYTVVQEGIGPSLAFITGGGSMPCFSTIVGLAFIPLMIILFWLRARAPCQAALTGALAGVGSAALSATAYALHCSNDHPSFVTIWYGLAILAMGALGAILAKRLIRW